MTKKEWFKEVVDLKERMDQWYDVKDDMVPRKWVGEYTISDSIANYLFNLDIDEMESELEIKIAPGIVMDIYYTIEDAIEIEDVEPFSWNGYDRAVSYMDLTPYKGN